MEERRFFFDIEICINHKKYLKIKNLQSQNPY